MILDLIQQSQADSLATAIGGQLGSMAAGWLVLGLGMANKWLVTAGVKLLSLQDKLPDFVKAVVAFAFAQGVTLVATQLSFLTANVQDLPVMMTGALVWAVSMGWHSLLKKLMPVAAAN